VISIDAAALASGTALIQVAWQVTGRAPGSNLVFEQVFEDGTFQSIELPRQYLWVPSAGQGPVAPVVPLAPGSPVRLRLRVIDLVSGNAYAEQTITVNVVGFAARPPAISTPVAPTPAPVIRRCSPAARMIASFVAALDVTRRGGHASWEVRGTAG